MGWTAEESETTRSCAHPALRCSNAGYSIPETL
jgi:hypothetical protein